MNADTADVINNNFVMTDETKIDLKRMQRQNGSHDCRVFAIVVSTGLLHGLDVSQVTFRQNEM